jgi:hypothetical protein
MGITRALMIADVSELISENHREETNVKQLLVFVSAL